MSKVVPIKLALTCVACVALLAVLLLWPWRQTPLAAAAPVFKLPWQAGLRMYVLQGPGQGSHTGYSSKFAYDFATDPVRGASFLVRASRGGRVAKVVQSFPESPDCDPARNLQANYILLDHGDGLGSLYLHLAQNSAIPKEGAWVNQGDPLALAGHSGFICGPPHLHFTVLNIKTWESLAIPFSDRDAQRHAGSLRANQWYVSENIPTSYAVSLPHVTRRYSNGLR